MGHPEFSRDSKHVSPEWPKGYSPNMQAPATAKAWDDSLKSFHRDLAAMKKLIANPRTDLFARIPLEQDKQFSAKPCLSRTTLRIIWGRLWSFAGCWAFGK